MTADCIVLIYPMKKSVETQLIDFLRSNPSKFASAELQRMPWKNKNQTLATPRSIVRRLEENAEEGGMLQVTYDDHNNAFYNIKEGFQKKEFIDYVRNPLTGQMITTKEYALL